MCASLGSEHAATALSYCQATRTAWGAEVAFARENRGIATPGLFSGRRGRIAPFAESCIRKAVAERGLTPGLVGLADAKAEDEAATGTAFALRSRLNRWARGVFWGECSTAATGKKRGRARPQGVPIATEQKTTNLARGPGFTAFRLLETRLRWADSRTCIRERLSRTESPQNRVVSPEGLGTPRLPSFTRRLAWEDRCFLLRCYRKPT